MSRARSRLLPEKPCNLSEVTYILQDPTLACLTATTGFDDSIYGASRSGEDGSHAILLMSQRCNDFMKIAPFVFGLTVPFTLSGCDQQLQVISFQHLYPIHPYIIF